MNFIIKHPSTGGGSLSTDKNANDYLILPFRRFPYIVLLLSPFMVLSDRSSPD